MFSDLFRRQPTPPPRSWTARAPEGQRIYAIGDIHGRLDLLESVLEAIRADAADAPGLRHTLVYLGDYVDRGMESKAVLDRLIQGPPPGFEAVHLRGNHEDTLLEFLRDVRAGIGWLQYGGIATLVSYGIRRPPGLDERAWLEQAQRALRAALPPEHRAFLEGLRLAHVAGDYLFVHAGIRPGQSLATQDPEDLLWIREEFLEATDDHGKIVVHGHSISDVPEVRANRIGIDTGAFASGRLTALVLEGAQYRFLST